MKRMKKRLGSLCMSVVMLLSMAVTPAMAADTQDPPTKMTVSSNFGSDFILAFGYAQSEWAGKITGVQVNGESWTLASSSFGVDSNKCYYVRSNDAYVYIGEGFSGDEATCVISATGYNDLTLKLNKTNYSAAVVKNSGSDSGNSGSNSGNSDSDSGNSGSGEDAKNPPTEMECAYTSGMPDMLTLTVNDSEWLAAVAANRAMLAVNNMTYTYEDDFGMFCSDPYWHVKGNNIEFVVTSSYSFFPAVFTLSADGYKDVKITVSKTGNWPNESVSVAAEVVGGSDSGDSGNGGSGGETPDTGKTAPTAVKYYYSSFMPMAHYFGASNEADGNWLQAITAVKVNGTTYAKGDVGYNSSGNYWNVSVK